MRNHLSLGVYLLILLKERVLFIFDNSSEWNIFRYKMLLIKLLDLSQEREEDFSILILNSICILIDRLD